MSSIFPADSLGHEPATQRTEVGGPSPASRPRPAARLSVTELLRRYWAPTPAIAEPEPPAAGPRCRICDGPNPLEPEGGCACWSCIAKYGSIANDPQMHSYDLVSHLWDEHRDVVSLVVVGRRSAWRWLGWS